MTINYVLFENKLTNGSDSYAARVVPASTAGLDDLVDRMIQRGLTIARSEILSLLEDYYTAIEGLVLEGRNVITPVTNFGTSIKGNFSGQSDRFDPSRHQITATVNPGVRLRKAVEERARVVKQEAVKPRPNLLEYTDLNTVARNSTLTPGGMAQVVGHRLKFDPNDANQGIYFIAADGTETKVTIVGRNKPAELMFIVPDSLTAGDYTLEVRAIVSGDEVRAGTLDAALTVA
jgi:hypothetical protein